MMSLVSVVFAAALVYQNDFTTRTSAEGTGPGLEWYVYRYVKGQPAAYNWNGFGSDRRIRPYDWQPTQDGWTKLLSVIGDVNYLGSHITNEDDPCMVFSSGDATVNGKFGPAKSRQGYIAHTFRNVFKTGDVKLQVDLRQPLKIHSGDNVICWFRPMLEDGLKLDLSDSTYSVIDVGLTASSLTGGWRDTAEGKQEGDRQYVNYGVGLATAGHWFRQCITIHLDSNLVDFEVYDLGTERLPMDQAMTGSPVASRTGCVSRFNIGGGTHGGLSGFAVNVQALNTEGFFGDASFDADYAYMIDNIKGSYKASGSDSYVEFYRNDFTASKRRTVDGSIGSRYDYVLDEPVTLTETYTLRDYLVRDISDYSQNGKPYLSGVYNNSAATFGQVQEPGADGWRIMGAKDFKAPVFVTTNGANKVFSISTFGKNIQPMCPEVTNGLCKFEIDIRMPKGFVGTPRCEFNLSSEKAYLAANDYVPILRVGPCASDGKDTGTVASPNYNRGIFGNGVHFGADNGKKYGVNKWYRIRAFCNLDTKKFDLYVYEIGDAAPIDPDGFTPDSSNQMLCRTNRSLASPSGYASGIGSFGLANWVNTGDSGEGNDAQQFQIFFDNVRFWKQNGNDWDLLYVNTGDQTKRTYTVARKSLVDEKNDYIDRPEYCLDGFNIAPTYILPTYITGANHALRFNGFSYTAYSVPLGRSMRSGIMEFQYDVRLPYDTEADAPLQFYIGGAQLGSATILPSAYPQRFNSGYAVGTGIYNDRQTHANGVRNVMRGVNFEGNGAAKWYFTINTPAQASGKWIRIKVKANLNAKTYSIVYYDMGSTHPTLDTPDGTILKDYSTSDIAFRWGTDPISHIYFVGGHTPSFMPWHDEAYGALLLDNIKVCHEKFGTCVIVR